MILNPMILNRDFKSKNRMVQIHNGSTVYSMSRKFCNV